MLVLNSLCIHYGRVEVVKGISLRLDQAEMVTIVGANGAGKTTTLRAISGLIKPSAGTIEFNGRRIDGLSAHAILRMGISQVPEGSEIFEQMSALENLELGALVVKDKQIYFQNLEHVFELFPILRHRQKQIAGSLSGGERRMLSIARSLMSNPKLLLLDEPSMGLAPKVVDLMFDTIKRLNEQRITILLLEQNTELALDLCSRGYVMEAGNIVLSGRAKDLLHNEMVIKAYLGL